MLDASRKADRLAKSVERLEARYAKAGTPNPGYFYVPTDPDNTWGRTLDPEWTDHAPSHERRPRREAIDAALALRAAVDSAMEAVSKVSAYMDSEAQPIEQRWTIRTIGHLRKLRGAIVLGFKAQARPTALPLIRAGVPDALRECARPVFQRMEEVKSAIVAGVQPRTPTVFVSPDLLDSLQRAAVVNPQAIARVSGGGESGVAKPRALFAGAVDNTTPTYPTTGDLAAVAGVSNDTFRRVRNAAGIEVKERGAAARRRRYVPSEVDGLIAAALAGNFIERAAMAEKWARWGSNQTADKPQISRREAARTQVSRTRPCRC
ncbi:MAG: hypothetical protein ACK5TV_05650 [Phycisphaerales bacterium]